MAAVPVKYKYKKNSNLGEFSIGCGAFFRLLAGPDACKPPLFGYNGIRLCRGIFKRRVAKHGFQMYVSWTQSLAFYIRSGRNEY
jgi:hypothetical protein